jgi:hypothetical protein
MHDDAQNARSSYSAIGARDTSRNTDSDRHASVEALDRNATRNALGLAER